MDPNKVPRTTLVIVSILLAVQIIKTCWEGAMWFRQRFIDQGSSQRWGK